MDLNSESLFIIFKLSSAPLPKPMPGSMAILSFLMPALTAKDTLSFRWLNISDIRSSYLTSICIVTGVPLVCISITPTLVFAHTSAIAGSNLMALISFTICAPASIACLATSALVVSTDMAASVFLAASFITGITLLSSSSGETGLEPGLDDSPPTSIISAPSSAICSAFFTASPFFRYWPPS